MWRGNVVISANGSSLSVLLSTMYWLTSPSVSVALKVLTRVFPPNKRIYKIKTSGMTVPFVDFILQPHSNTYMHSYTSSCLHTCSLQLSYSFFGWATGVGVDVVLLWVGWAACFSALSLSALFALSRAISSKTFFLEKYLQARVSPGGWAYLASFSSIFSLLFCSAIFIASFISISCLICVSSWPVFLRTCSRFFSSSFSFVSLSALFCFIFSCSLTKEIMKIIFTLSLSLPLLCLFFLLFLGEWFYLFGWFREVKVLRVCSMSLYFCFTA